MHSQAFTAVVVAVVMIMALLLLLAAVVRVAALATSEVDGRRCRSVVVVNMAVVGGGETKPNKKRDATGDTRTHVVRHRQANQQFTHERV